MRTLGPALFQFWFGEEILELVIATMDIHSELSNNLLVWHCHWQGLHHSTKFCNPLPRHHAEDTQNGQQISPDPSVDCHTTRTHDASQLILMASKAFSGILWKAIRAQSSERACRERERERENFTSPFSQHWLMRTRLCWSHQPH